MKISSSARTVLAQIEEADMPDIADMNTDENDKNIENRFTMTGVCEDVINGQPRCRSGSISFVLDPSIVLADEAKQGCEHPAVACPGPLLLCCTAGINRSHRTKTSASSTPTAKNDESRERPPRTKTTPRQASARHLSLEAINFVAGLPRMDN